MCVASHVFGTGLNGSVNWSWSVKKWENKIPRMTFKPKIRVDADVVENFWRDEGQVEEAEITDHAENTRDVRAELTPILIIFGKRHIEALDCHNYSPMEDNSAPLVELSSVPRDSPKQPLDLTHLKFEK